MSKSNFPHFCIVTPSFNQADYIAQTIDSVLDQQWKKLAYWVIDGNSSDNTVKILKGYGKKILWVSENDQGQTDAINKGISKIERDGTFDPENAIFAFINSDDYYLPGAFKIVSDAFTKHPHAQWVSGNYQVSSYKHNKSHNLIALAWKSAIKNTYSTNTLKVLNPIAQCATFFRWSAIKKIGQFNTSLRYTMDYEYWLRAQQKFGSPVFIPDELAVFRIHPASKGGAEYKKQFAEQYLVAKRFTDNPVLLGLHRLHNWATITGYNLLK